jgi:hypothetical protein
VEWSTAPHTGAWSTETVEQTVLPPSGPVQRVKVIFTTPKPDRFFARLRVTVP